MTFYLNLNSLHEDIPVISYDAMGFYVENCVVCLEHQGHQNNTDLSIDHQGKSYIATISWTMVINDSVRRAYQDLNRATDFGAVTIALLLVRELTDYTTVEQSAIGTTVDYYLSRKTDEPTLIFNHAARLEVSGILQENESNTIQRRIQEKKRRLIPDTRLPTFIVIVEFSTPQSKIVEA